MIEGWYGLLVLLVFVWLIRFVLFIKSLVIMILVEISEVEKI